MSVSAVSEKQGRAWARSAEGKAAIERCVQDVLRRREKDALSVAQRQWSRLRRSEQRRGGAWPVMPPDRTCPLRNLRAALRRASFDDAIVRQLLIDETAIVEAFGEDPQPETWLHLLRWRVHVAGLSDKPSGT